MRLKAMGTLVGMALLVAYLLPIAIKLAEVPLIVIVACGIALAALDAWHTLTDRNE